VGRNKLPKGWTEGSVQELLGLSDEEAAIVEMRVRLAERVRKRRRSQRITQKDLARRMRSTQPRIARLEQADASIEMLMRALFVLGAASSRPTRASKCSCGRSLCSVLIARRSPSCWRPETAPLSGLDPGSVSPTQRRVCEADRPPGNGLQQVPRWRRARPAIDHARGARFVASFSRVSEIVRPPAQVPRSSSGTPRPAWSAWRASAIRSRNSGWFSRR